MVATVVRLMVLHPMVLMVSSSVARNIGTLHAHDVWCVDEVVPMVATVDMGRQLGHDNRA